MSATLRELIDSIHGHADSRLVSVVDAVLEELERNALAWRVQLPPRLVGIHPKNRGGWGVAGGDVHKLGSKIVAMGWSPQATAHAVCVEDPDGTAAAFTGRLVAESDGLLAANSKDVKFGSLACTHTNQFLVCAAAGVKTDFENIAVNGKMSLHKCGQDEKLREAMTNGLTWLVISSKAVRDFPSLPDLVQAARNATGAVHSREDSIQLLQKAQSMASTTLKRTGSVDWADVSHSVIRMAHCTADELSPIIAFVQKYGGGNTTAFVDDLGKFFKAFVKPGRTITGTTWQALADVKVGANELCPLMMYAVLKAQGMSKKVDGGICKDFTPAEILGMSTSKKTSMMQGERVLAECRSVARSGGATDDLCNKAFGRLDVLVARIVIGKNKDSINLDEAVADFMNTISGKPGKPCTSPASGSAAAVQNVVQYDEDGSAVAAGALAVRTEGFCEGVTVIAAKAAKDDLYTIDKVHDDGSVVLKSLRDSAKTIAVGRDDFLKQYHKTNDSYEELEGWSEHRPSKQATYTDAVLRAHVLTAMATVASGADVPDLKVMLKPSKGVFSNASYAVNKMVLFPESTKITVGDCPGEGSLKGTVDGVTFYLSSASCTASFAVPAWIVKTTPDEPQSNVHVILRKVAVAINDTAVDVRIPTLVNHRKLKDGDELLIHRAVVEKKAAAKRPLSMPATAKGKAKAKASSKS